mgnify:CR=1 FL=1
MGCCHSESSIERPAREVAYTATLGTKQMGAKDDIKTKANQHLDTSHETAKEKVQIKQVEITDVKVELIVTTSTREEPP